MGYSLHSPALHLQTIEMMESQVGHFKSLHSYLTAVRSVALIITREQRVNVMVKKYYRTFDKKHLCTRHTFQNSSGGPCQLHVLYLEKLGGARWRKCREMSIIDQSLIIVVVN